MKAMKMPAIWIALLLVVGTAWAGRGHGELPFTENLYADAQLAQQKQLPIMVVFVSEHCGFCNALEADYIKPMLISGEYENKILIRVFDVNNHDMINFQGKTMTASKFANDVGAWVTPTVMFFDAEGNEVAEKILGYSTPGLYGGVLDSAIDQSLANVRQGKTLASR